MDTHTFTLMVPDFQPVRKNAVAPTNSQSFKPSSDHSFSESQSFLQIPEQPVATADHTTADNLDELFFQLWTKQPSWSPIVKTDSSWITIVNPSGKKVPLVIGTVKSYYRRGLTLGKRFGKLTDYLVIDLDINSSFHPSNGGYRPILDTMERLGLCRFLIVRSSTSGGLHLYFPLPEPVSSWELAQTAHSALTADGIHVIGGQCELFPNKKAFNAEHNGHRLPLQDGSFLLDEDFCPISNCKADFVVRWQTAAAHQDMTRLKQALASKAVVVPLLPQTGPLSLPPIAWTGFGQSNVIMRQLANYGDRYVGKKTVDDLAAWIKAVAPQLPGYQKFASPKSKKDIEHGNWPTRWAKSHFESAWQYGNSGSDHNAKVAHDARSRLFAALDRVCVAAEIGITKLWKTISDIATVCFNKGVAWKTFKKYEAEVLVRIRGNREVGLSSTVSEDVSSFSSELVGSSDAGPELAEKKGSTQLLTLRCVIAIYSNVFASFDTPKNRASGGGYPTSKTATAAQRPSTADTSEAVLTAVPGRAIEKDCSQVVDGNGAERWSKGLVVGQPVRIAMPGGSLDGVETRVQAQVLNTLGQPVYQLTYQQQGQAVTLPAECLQPIQVEDKMLPSEQTIKATAAQLLTVLGKACPFFGPGLWTVKRDEIPAQAWAQLRRLVGEV